ncbi:MAG: hypothetical protein K8I60_19145, partial [Anaerolineae bacterium]|nr:hypothetical protein [Anaerolineae bacterium]
NGQVACVSQQAEMVRDASNVPVNVDLSNDTSIPTIAATSGGATVTPPGEQPTPTVGVAPTATVTPPGSQPSPTTPPTQTPPP